MKSVRINYGKCLAAVGHHNKDDKQRDNDPQRQLCDRTAWPKGQTGEIKLSETAVKPRHLCLGNMSLM